DAVVLGRGDLRRVLLHDLTRPIGPVGCLNERKTPRHRTWRFFTRKASLQDSGFAHAGHRLGRSTRTNLLFDPATYFGVDALPVVEGTLQHRAAHAAQQAAGHLFDQPGALRVVEHFTHQGARLAEVV